MRNCDGSCIRHVRNRFVANSTAPSSSSLQLFDSLSESLQPLASSSDKGLAIYICGPTVYDDAHLGHARTYVSLDILRRTLDHAARAAGQPPPLIVMNITDVDDKILAAAEASDEVPLSLARRYEAAFWNDLLRLHCLPPHVVVRVTDHVESAILPYIERLVDEGMAYETLDGVYFDVRAMEERRGSITCYGKLAPPASASDLYTRLEPATTTVKRDPRDFVLWKAHKPGERMYWASRFGNGRPGWHIECSAMIEAVAQQFSGSYVFGAHAGGIDLKFPHHTNEIAQAEAYHELEPGKEWIPHWIHTGHLHIDGRKMSKSLKNFITIRQLLDEDSSSSALSSPADDFRLWCLGLDYRSAATYSEERLAEARSRREKMVRVLLEGEEWLQRHDGQAVQWNETDRELFVGSGNASTAAIRALRSELDGASFLDHIQEILLCVKTYLETADPQQRPSEPLRCALHAIRDHLALVGFSPVTCHAGLDLVAAVETTSHVVGGERALLDELVRFRARVRHLAIAGDEGALSNILDECDKARDEIFPAMGVELKDDRAVGDKDASLWKFCLPRKPTPPSPTSSLSHKPTLDELQEIPLENFFRLGQYEDQFTEFDEEGLPTRYADGSQVSGKQRKKLRRKLQKHSRRLENLAQ